MYTCIKRVPDGSGDLDLVDIFVDTFCPMDSFFLFFCIFLTVISLKIAVLDKKWIKK